MKAEFELTVHSETGEPYIKFRHHDKSDELFQKVLGSFINKAKEKGVKITSTGGSAGMGQSHNNYEIRINEGEYQKHMVESMRKYSSDPESEETE